LAGDRLLRRNLAWERLFGGSFVGRGRVRGRWLGIDREPVVIWSRLIAIRGRLVRICGRFLAICRRLVGIGGRFARTLRRLPGWVG
jgi:hypothetical protein